MIICEKDEDNYHGYMCYNQRQMSNKMFYFFQNVDYSVHKYVCKIHINTPCDEKFQIKYTCL